MMNYSGVPSVGTVVLTSDGSELGKVKEVMGDCFKVDAPMAPDYWLGIDTIEGGGNMGDTGGGAGFTGRETTVQTIRLKYHKDHLDEIKQDSPEHKGYHRHTM
jgi:hypothetical protein